MATVQNQVVLITGASSGIGLAAAKKFAREGARVMLSARREAALQEACQQIQSAGGVAEYFVSDVSQQLQVDALVDHTMAKFDRIDVLVNNAGYGHFKTIAETSAEELEKLMAVNVYGTFYASKAVLPIMQRQRSGNIIMVSSVAGKRVFRPGGGIYNVSKFAMQGFTEALRMELRDTPIKVCAVCPVTTATEFFDFSEKQTGQKARLHGPIQTSEQVADVIIDLARRPRPEVIMIGPLRLLFAFQQLFPGLADYLVARFMK